MADVYRAFFPNMPSAEIQKYVLQRCLIDDVLFINGFSNSDRMVLSVKIESLVRSIGGATPLSRESMERARDIIVYWNELSDYSSDVNLNTDPIELCQCIVTYAAVSKSIRRERDGL